MKAQTMDQLKGHNRLADALADVGARYRAANPESLARWERAGAVMPGGNTRTVLHYDPFPVTVVKGEGTYLHDMDGHRYRDFLGEYSAGLYGHSNAIIEAALKEAIEGGMALGAPNRWEAPLAELVCARFPSIDMVRFTNSGTEANLMALGAARAFTKRDIVMVFEGAYHGGVLTFAHGASPVNVPFRTVIAAFNDSEGALALIEENRDRLAAVLIEPMMGAGGCLPADRAFLQGLREATTRQGILLIFDEVMTSRSAAGGLQQRLGVTPDMTTLGKYLGGGASFGAFGGRRDIMALFDPTSPHALPHAGTFNNNAMSMAAGYAGLSQVFTPEAADQLYLSGEAFRERLNALAASKGAALSFTGCGSIIGLHTHARGAAERAEDEASLQDRKRLLHLEMMLRGFAFAQRGYLSLNLAMSEDDLDRFAHALDEVLDQHADLLTG